MTIKRLELHNYMIHRDLAADFSGNLIALTGEMGHGKSTFVGAIQFCLTGEHPPWHREDLVSWGETEGSAKLEFSHEGLECSIVRNLHNPTVVLKIGEDTVTGAKNVERALETRLGVDKDILKQIGFVQQYEVQSILFDDPGKRERAFQKLLGIGDANKIWTELGPVIQSYMRTENFDASIAALKQSIEQVRSDLASVDRSLDADERALGLLPDSGTLQGEIDRLTPIRAKTVELARARENCAAARASLAAATERRTKAGLSRTRLVDSLGMSQDEMEAYIGRLAQNSASCAAALESMRKLSDASSANGSCPLCGSAVSDGQIAGHVSSELARLEKRSAAAEASFRDVRDSYMAVRSQIVSIAAEINCLDMKIAQSDALAASESARERKLLDDVAALGLDASSSAPEKLRADAEARLNDLYATRGKIAELELEIARLRGGRDARAKQLADAEKALEAKVREKEMSVPVAEKIETLTRVRNWFHSSNGPRTMSTSAVESMTGYVNDYLKALNAEIQVYPDRQCLGFAYDYVDGRPVSDPLPSTSKLSGGQKIELALAFRLAIYRYFGQKMGIMVLDEPTAHLSPDGISHFGELLQTVSALARNMNLQIIMPTHEKEIMPYMDSEIHFS